jgi:hypothetical protein
MKPQTTAQILRCFTLGRCKASVVEGELRIRGPQPLAGPLPASIKAQRDELTGFLEEYSGGVWPPRPGSGLWEVEQFLDCGLSSALDIVEASPAKLLSGSYPLKYQKRDRPADGRMPRN